ncbi:hypothetical protein AC529_14540 [Thermobifida cellulosilytica TB100]|uniref:Uncharacterized protein n=1 Tax=Thermobifida cellulosilytica TB100 TaxID=665004 RepID=A0A147KFK5_THECS|nr:hypothetical protein AC529_14540 [Thermobifida cellulosilytica TB100]
MAHLPQRGELQDASAALGLLVPVGAVGQRAGFGLVGHAQVGAEHVDTHLPQRPGGASSAKVDQGDVVQPLGAAQRAAAGRVAACSSGAGG